MRTVTSLILVALSASTALAQNAPPPPPQQYPPQQYPQQGDPQQYPQQYPPQQYPPQQYPPQQYPPNYGPQYAYPAQPPMQVQLTVDEQWLLERGFISQGEHIGGGVAALFLGFGIGQAIQGRWSDKGWIFTVGEGVAFGAMIYGMMRAFDCSTRYDEYNNSFSDCEDDGIGIMVVGLLGYSVLRIWETVDAFAAPSAHNRKVRQLRARLGLPVPLYDTRLMPYMAPTRDREGGVAGFSLRF